MAKINRFESLDAWRGICALVVALEHLTIANPLRDNAFVHHGYRFVDFFFVLSGFVITHAYRERVATGWQAVRSFLIRRVGRLWPLHITVLVFFVALELASTLAEHFGFGITRSSTDRNSLSALVPNVFLVHSWGMLDRPTWNNPSWSISTELFAYGLFAALYGMLPVRWVGRAMAVLVALAAAALLFVAPGGMKSTYDYGLVRCVYGFLIGVGVKHLWERYPLRIGTIGEIAVVAAVVVGVTWLPSDDLALLVTPLFGVAVWCFASEDGKISAVLRTRWPQALGVWSYSIYMIHAFIVISLLVAASFASKAGFRLFERVDGVATLSGSLPLTTLIIVGYLGVVIVMARFTYKLVELPGQRFFARWTKSS